MLVAYVMWFDVENVSWVRVSRDALNYDGHTRVRRSVLLEELLVARNREKR